MSERADFYEEIEEDLAQYDKVSIMRREIDRLEEDIKQLKEEKLRLVGLVNILLNGSRRLELTNLGPGFRSEGILDKIK